MSSTQDFKHCCGKYQYNSLLVKQQKQNSILQFTRFLDVTMKKYRPRKKNLHFIAGKSCIKCDIYEEVAMTQHFTVHKLLQTKLQCQKLVIFIYQPF